MKNNTKSATGQGDTLAIDKTRYCRLKTGDAVVDNDDATVHKKQRVKTLWDTSSRSLSKKLSLESVVGSDSMKSTF